MRLALGWILAAALFGPLVYGIGVASQMIIGGDPFWRSSVWAIPSVVLGIASFGIPSIILGVPIFGPLLVSWAMIARWWARLECVGGVMIGTLVLAALGTVLLSVSAETDLRPLAPHGRTVLYPALQGGGLLWLALILPRVLIPPLRHGAFATAEPQITASGIVEGIE